MEDKKKSVYKAIWYSLDFCVEEEQEDGTNITTHQFTYSETDGLHYVNGTHAPLRVLEKALEHLNKHGFRG